MRLTILDAFCSTFILAIIYISDESFDFTTNAIKKDVNITFIFAYTECLNPWTHEPNSTIKLASNEALKYIFYLA